MRDSINNLYRCLACHPAIAALVAAQLPVNILIGTDAGHRSQGRALAMHCPTDWPLTLEHLSLDQSTSTDVCAAIVRCDMFVFLYSASTLSPPSPAGPSFLDAIRQTMLQYWRKSVLFKDYGQYLFEAFSEPIESIAQRNDALIRIATNARRVCYTDGRGGKISAPLSAKQKWTSISGRGNEDVVPGEIATHLRDLNGELRFSGTFLSTVPFARKYGVVDDFMTLNIRHGRLASFDCANKVFERDFKRYLEHNDGNQVIEEFGIGTNLGVRKLYGLNAGFEERHPGLHLGLGGGKPGSHHMDLIFRGGSIAFDDSAVFQDGFLI